MQGFAVSCFVRTPTVCKSSSTRRSMGRAATSVLSGYGAPDLTGAPALGRDRLPGGEIDALKPPFNLSGFAPRMDAIPALGEHSRAILAELGYSEAEVGRLAASGTI